MTSWPQRKEKKLGPPFVVSLLCHLLFVFLCAWSNLLGPIALKSAPVYYVDLVNLPVAHPQAASGEAAGGAPQLPPPKAASPAMKLPAKAVEPAKETKAPAPAAQRAKGETSREFEERLARMERDAEARRQAGVMEALRNKAAAGTAAKAGTAARAGAPGASGTQAGSYYDTYIRSRLEDAFRVEDTFKPDQNKIMLVRITIGPRGRIMALQVDQKSSDKMFNDAVMRAISRAEKDFPPSPNGAPVELPFRFSPQEVRKQ
jgi:colicin import membrane protein